MSGFGNYKVKTALAPFNLVCLALGGLVLLFLIAPLAGMFLSTSGIELTQTARDPEVQRSIWLTLWTAMAATGITAIGAIPFAYLLARRNFPLKRLVSAIITIPVVIPHSAAGIAILGIISRESLAGRTAEHFGLRFVSSSAGIIAAMAFVSLPYLINAARDGFSMVPVRLEQVALTLGASRTRVFFTITLPLAWRSIVSGLILMWGRGMSEFGAVIIVAYHPMITPVLIFERFNQFGLKYARAVCVLFIIICLILFIALRLISGSDSRVTHSRNI
jgi:molybdate/tungstate transport system permease protein